MKTIQRIIAILIISTAFFSCTEDDTQIFIADLSSDVIEFQNSFASEYLLSDDTEENIADRFIWNQVTTVTTNQYELQAAIDADFTNITSIGSTSSNNIAVYVKQLLSLARELNLDDDPTTTDASGNPNNFGTVYFRVRASIGNGGAGSDEIFSEPTNINITIIEKTLNTGQCDSLYVLGEGITDAGWNFPGIEVTCDTDVLTVKARLQSGHFRFFTTVGDWNSGQDYTFFENDGYTIDSRLENAPAGDNFNFIGTPGIYTITIDKVNKTIDLQESGSLWAVGGAVPGGWGFNSDTVEFIENTPDVWSASITLSNDIFRFFKTFGTWDTNNNMTFYEDEGFTIDSNFENDGSGDGNFNFIGSPGTYTMTINAIDKTITLN
ncbi:SusE domain-containing protein [Polaribacter marinivivus]|uniref:SusE domain-containing protein n=1 Tax=Polaribacter marinivivus TaxID=1524260 RepID=UPI003D329ECE